MARAFFRSAIAPRGRAPGTPIRAGNKITGTVVVYTLERHTDIELTWRIAWIIAQAFETTVRQDRIPIAVIEPLVPHVFRFETEIPSDSRPSEEVKWFLEVSLDIPWALDPAGHLIFTVLPWQRPKIKARRASRASDVCPFCKDTVRDDRWTCAVCGTAHHDECRALYGRCTIPGCSGK